MILDSGDRTEFPSGAVRDMRVGKGRCDLMPLQVVAKLLHARTGDHIFGGIARFTQDMDTRFLYTTLMSFAAVAFEDKIETLILETAKHFEAGALKYGENNWQRGIPTNCYIDSAIRHYLKWRRGDKDEPHDLAFVWNIMCCIWEVDYHDKNSEC